MEPWFQGGGAVGALMRHHDWAASPLGPPATWPRSLSTIVRVLLTSRYAMWLGWGPELTLMLGPTEDALSSGGVMARDQLETLHRNQLRLLKLVNALLDFSRMEAGRTQAAYEPVDLARLTTDLASTFRSAIERGGLRFDVDCPPLPEPIYVDRHMWEQIVLGIPAHELTRVFDRFHRIEGTRARTHEGSGIGLALVHDLIALHGGGIVDDNVDAAAMLAEFVRSLGYRVRTACDGPGALKAAADVSPQVALLDIGLPVMDGYELAARLREVHSSDALKLIAVTGYGQAADRDRSREAGFDAHLVKPVDLDDLAQLLHALTA
jgi:CheY-like chemotaxis protein